MKKFTIGLTGGIASGKSVAAEFLGELGGEIIDADVVSREIGQEEIAEAFPQAVSGGRLDRRRLREIVFGDEDKLRLLNSIAHPLIVKRILELNEGVKGVSVIVAPLLFETGLHRYCDRVINITASLDVRIRRLKKRDNIDEGLAYNMIAAQASEETRRAIADSVIINDGSEDDLKRLLTEWWTENIESKN